MDHVYDLRHCGSRLSNLIETAEVDQEQVESRVRNQMLLLHLRRVSSCSPASLLGMQTIAHACVKQAPEEACMCGRSCKAVTSPA